MLFCYHPLLAGTHGPNVLWQVHIRALSYCFLATLSWHCKAKVEVNLKTNRERINKQKIPCQESRVKRGHVLLVRNVGKIRKVEFCFLIHNRQPDLWMKIYVEFTMTKRIRLQNWKEKKANQPFYSGWMDYWNYWTFEWMQCLYQLQLDIYEFMWKPFIEKHFQVCEMSSSSNCLITHISFFPWFTICMPLFVHF